MPVLGIELRTLNARSALYSRLSHFPDEGCSPGEADLPEVAQLSSSSGKLLCLEAVSEPWLVLLDLIVLLGTERPDAVHSGY